MIGWLQREFGYLYNKYLKQNISGCRSEISGSFRRTLQLCNILPSVWSDPGKFHGGSGHGWSRKLKCLLSHPDMFAGWSWNASFPIRILNSGCHPGVDAAPDVSGGSLIPDVIHPDGNGGSQMEFLPGWKSYPDGISTLMEFLPGWKWAGCSCLAKASSFQLQFVHRLKR